ncbi:MAG: adenylate/guanylate cyclase domain-containing protein [Hyphomicrobiales bacterium]
MAEERVRRRLAAILAADVVGYSRMMEIDEAGTLAALIARRREVLEPLVGKYQGRIFKVTGDGVLIEFGSAVNAVRCAVDLQRGMADANSGISEDRRIVLRIGINLGDVMVEGSDLYGDGVNIAARLEALAEPGGILVSGTAHAHIKNNIHSGFDDLGLQSLKNIAEPVRAFRVTGTPATAASNLVADKPSIAVLPFTNMSGDPEQEYFSDGITEDIISGLARLHWLFVIARNSSFTFKGNAVDVKRVGQQLGVRYVLEGSVRKAGERVRITSQLIDAGTGAHIWTDRFDGALSDIFVLQDRVTASVVGAIGPKLRKVEIERARAKPTENIGAYDLFLRALALHNTLTVEAYEEALRLLDRAVVIDPEYASAYGLAAYCHLRQLQRGWGASAVPGIEKGIRSARLAAELGQDDPEALWMAGLVLAMLAGESEGGLGLIERSMILNPNSAGAWMASGMAHAYRGESTIAIDHLDHAAQLSPLDPLAYLFWYGTAFAHFAASRYSEATGWVDRSLRAAPNYMPGMRLRAALCGVLGQAEEGRKWVSRIVEVNPDTRLRTLRVHLTRSIHKTECLDALIEGLRKAGFPE